MNVTTKEQDWLKRQVVADLNRHEGFREFAYPDPLSALYKKFSRLPWGLKPATRDCSARHSMGPAVVRGRWALASHMGHPLTVV